MISLRKRRLSLRHVVTTAGVLLVFALVNTVTIQHVFAQVDIGPNADWFGGQDTVRYVLEQDVNVTGAGDQNIPIYVFNGSTTNKPTITVTANDSSSGFSGTMAAACISLNGNCSGTWCRIDCSFTIPASSFSYDKTIGGWTAMVYAHLMQGGIHEFRLTASNGATIGYYASKSASDRSFAVAHTYTAGHRYTYQIPFGSDCTVAAGGQPVSANIYDGDVGNNGIQPLPFQVRVIDDTDGSTPVSAFYSTLAQANAAGLGNNGIATYSWTAYPNHNYRFVIDNVASHNTLQFRLPFSSIYYNTTCHYSLTPSTSVNPNSSEANTTVVVSPTVNNTGTMSSGGTQWQLSRFVVPSGQSYPGAGTSASIPAVYYGHGLTSIGSGSGQSYAVGLTNLTQVTDDLGSQPAGTKVCYALSVKVVSDTDTNNSWAHGAPSCVVIAKKPKVQVWGGDLLGSGNITTSTTTRSGNTFGSWVEYGIFALKNIIGIGSGSAYSGQGLANATVCSESLLSFTNAADSTGCKNNGTIGNYTNASSIPDVAASFPVVTSGANLTPTIGPNDLSDPSKVGLFTASGNVTLNAATIGAGRWIVLNAPNANVTITGNITYANGPYSSIGEIPQLIIIAGNITIADSVTQVDAWLIASSGTISTCTFTSGDPNYLSFPAFPPFPSVSSQGGKKLNLTVNTCNQQLVVNGPVIAQSLDLLRTAGSETGVDSGKPGEVFNLRPDAYLWTAAHVIETGRLQTTYTTELPPRL